MTQQAENLKVFLLQRKYILFAGENAAGTDDKKMRQAIQKKNSR